ncbi:MAG: hypothetical protein KC900_13825 [Candidatus Omnitrophica bacterium]|nr:hypothetical protein [Candidatus Omnitrophota bacterium]
MSPSKSKSQYVKAANAQTVRQVVIPKNIPAGYQASKSGGKIVISIKKSQ